jgi:hypothetical protein
MIGASRIVGRAGAADWALCDPAGAIVHAGRPDSGSAQGQPSCLGGAP